MTYKKIDWRDNVELSSIHAIRCNFGIKRFSVITDDKDRNNKIVYDLREYSGVMKRFPTIFIVTQSISYTNNQNPKIYRAAFVSLNDGKKAIAHCQLGVKLSETPNALYGENDEEK